MQPRAITALLYIASILVAVLNCTVVGVYKIWAYSNTLIDVTAHLKEADLSSSNYNLSILNSILHIIDFIGMYYIYFCLILFLISLMSFLKGKYINHMLIINIIISLCLLISFVLIIDAITSFIRYKATMLNLF